MKVLFGIIECFILLVWMVLGFILWIPLLTRVIAAYVATIVASLYTQHDPTAARIGLQTAVGFYANGFTQISKHLDDARNGVTPISAASPKATNLTQVALEIGWSFVFWGLFFLLLPIGDIGMHVVSFLPTYQIFIALFIVIFSGIMLVMLFVTLWS
jgi:hypothetical protein